MFFRILCVESTLKQRDTEIKKRTQSIQADNEKVPSLLFRSFETFVSNIERPLHRMSRCELNGIEIVVENIENVSLTK